ncbi:dTDP-4-dehydrorhamnose 3,5-epimerase [Tenacibaculum dicentrarchi]|nr:dTDP-4-dehydrorhamnose 3,5-epimerase [Tenacibaculum dicentrarchi]MCD8415812.1 dTDP-4-dehydrorhamnose 3,5-epimerase [Tenacibaculum dicentrarchi]MCD8420936.1 dTDP-4-dehydrorhamnose 3,5-epimerase [Tenacibaculum dicentrarchi]MCD8438106.1 dTDP-4-dehydrorhamnose 3,5-epimerase [Tenacibaculum dicentrarchi]MCD8452505.1 dTDP-4-dehydrorhamnose 3,5-epimerase [Tenacibaculum dicentrarchi]
MKFIKTEIAGVVIIEPTIFKDERGYFYESFSQEKFNANIGENIGATNFIQDNESKSTFGVLRGLHFQKPPFAQAKLVRCNKGKVLDVVVDLRKKSATYGKHVSIFLSEENKKQLFVPRGFAHGFVVLSEEAIFSYKVDNKYAPSHEDGILCNDKTLNIDWNISQEKIILSAKDEILGTFKNFNSPF